MFVAATGACLGFFLGLTTGLTGAMRDTFALPLLRIVLADFSFG